jgi:glycosyltransferase involved in cell wall biosynthesis
MYQQKEKSYVSIVMYVYNTQDRISTILKGIDEMFFDHFANFEIILVNDFSTDASIQRVKEILPDLKGSLSLLNLAYHHGIENAMLAGQKLAIGDFVFELDTLNIDYPLNQLIDLYNESMKGFDIVSLSPKRKGQVFSRLFYNLLESFSSLKMRLFTETCRIVSRRAINRVGILNSTVNYRKAMYHYAGLPSKYLFYEPIKPVKYNDLSFSSRFNLAYEIIIRYSQLASQIAIGLSLLFFIFSVFMIAFVIASYIVVRNIASGWTTTMMFLTISFSGLFLVLSMILKYLDMLLRDKSIGKNYVYDSIEHLKNND